MLFSDYNRIKVEISNKKIAGNPKILSAEIAHSTTNESKKRVQVKLKYI
jgi:hypothetical protein